MEQTAEHQLLTAAEVLTQAAEHSVSNVNIHNALHVARELLTSLHGAGLKVDG